MTSPTPSNPIEDKLHAATRVPPPRPEFLADLRLRLEEEAQLRQESHRPASFGESIQMAFHRPAWVVAVVVLFLLVGILVAVGPQRVLAAFRQWFGYIPGVGIVDQSAPIRVLAEPVSVTREGISITVTSATLTGDRTHIEYRIFGVPGSAYPDREDVIGCMQPEYLRLPDGSQLTHMGNDFPPVPAAVNEAVFVMPCIFNTLPGKLPENWGLSLRFVPAPPDLTVMPVIELSPSPQASPSPESTALPENVGGIPTAPAEGPVTVSKVIETSDGYILIGRFQPQGQPGEWQSTGAAEIRDASGKKVAYTYPLDIQPDVVDLSQGGYGWAMQFKAAGLAYPLTITFPRVNIRQADPNATAKFTFDAGPNPQPGQEWTPDLEIQLAGHTLKLVWIMVDSRNGYSFKFQGDPEVDNASVQIVGYTPIGGGGGGSPTTGIFHVSLSYAQIPTGVLTVTVSNLIVYGDPITWQGQWSPATPRTDLPANPTSQPGLCLTTDTLAQLNPAPASLLSGKALLYEPVEGSDQWGLVLYNLDGSQKQVVVSAGNWGALSPDGSKFAYSGLDNGIHFLDLESQAEEVLPGVGGFDLHWSPDGKQIAYVGLGGTVIDSVFVASIDGSPARQISELSYESVVGWSPDSTQLYFVAPFTGGAAWKVYSFDLAGGVTREKFTIENGTPKFLNPTLSPDGQWITYRGRDNSSLYLVRTDGSDMHLVLDNVGAVRTVWSSSGWLGVSLQTIYDNQASVVLVKPEDCEAYLLPDLHGELEGLSIP